jgi:hypothetical protein
MGDPKNLLLCTPDGRQQPCYVEGEWLVVPNGRIHLKVFLVSTFYQIGEAKELVKEENRA